jgi:uncharacterized protein YcfJ
MVSRTTAVAGLLVLAAGVSGCENIGTAAQSKSVQGGLLGSALGAGAGAIIGNQSGDAGKGAAIGAGLGALSGALVGNAIDEAGRGAQQQSLPAATARMKICPVGNELYAEDVKYCPNHGVELRYKE